MYVNLNIIINISVKCSTFSGSFYSSKFAKCKIIYLHENFISPGGSDGEGVWALPWGVWASNPGPILFYGTKKLRISNNLATKSAERGRGRVLSEQFVPILA